MNVFLCIRKKSHSVRLKYALLISFEKSLCCIGFLSKKKCDSQRFIKASNLKQSVRIQNSIIISRLL